MINEPNLEYDLINSELIVAKCKTSDIYAQNLYAAMCNNEFFYGDYKWSCSWRMSGGIVAELRNIGEDYLNFYCSGVAYGYRPGYAPEGFVTDEIKTDLLKLGWVVRPYEKRSYNEQ